MKNFNVCTIIKCLRKLIKFIDTAERNRVCNKITKVHHKRMQEEVANLDAIAAIHDLGRDQLVKSGIKTRGLAKYLTDLSNA